MVFDWLDGFKDVGPLGKLLLIIVHFYLQFVDVLGVKMSLSMQNMCHHFLNN